MEDRSTMEEDEHRPSGGDGNDTAPTAEEESRASDGERPPASPATAAPTTREPAPGPQPRSPLVSAFTSTVTSLFHFLQPPGAAAASSGESSGGAAPLAATMTTTSLGPKRANEDELHDATIRDVTGHSTDEADPTGDVAPGTSVPKHVALVPHVDTDTSVTIHSRPAELMDTWTGSPGLEAGSVEPDSTHSTSRSQRGSKNAPAAKKHGKKKLKAQRHGKGKKSRTTALSPTSPVSGPTQVARRPSNSKGAGRSHSRTTMQIPVDDPHPNRVVNPLALLPIDHHHPVTTTDLWRLLDLSFPVPDTYSIAYSARLLGYRVPPTVPPNRAGTPVRFVRGLLDSRQDPIYAIPHAGRPLSLVAGTTNHDNDDDAVLGDGERDPFYETLLDNQHRDEAEAITGAQLAKLNAALAGAVPSPLQGTMELARELGVLSAKDDIDNNMAAVAWAGDREEPHALAVMRRDGSAHPIFDAPPAPCAVVLLRNNEPVAWASYTFMWYPCSPQKFELVLVLYNLQTTEVNALDASVAALSRTDELYFVLLASCALEHARLCSVHYAVAPDVSCLRRHFRMVHRGGRLVCDLHKCSTRYALLSYRQPGPSTGAAASQEGERPSQRRRWLAQLPLASELKRKGNSQPVHAKDSSSVQIQPPAPPPSAPHASEAAPAAETAAVVVVPENPGVVKGATASPARKPGKKRPPSGPAKQFTSAPAAARTGQVHIRAHLKPDGSVQAFIVPPSGRTSASGNDQLRPARVALKVDTDPVPIQLMRDFAVREPLPEPCEILQELQSCQDRLRAVEAALHGRTHELMGCVVLERIEFERQAQARREEQEILEQYDRKLERRKQLDLAWQKQLEQDMDAVCDVCNDGEVTPDNQILFCEACNVAVHQMCYGIDRIPDGDYYCIACRYLGRDQARLNSNGDPMPPTAPKLLPSPLPVCCELCPRKQGAYLRSAVRKGSEGEFPFGKWVHAVCAKWLGLDYVSVPDVVEDVTDWKKSFRRNRIKCHLCEGERGCMNRCSFEGCDKWQHVTCARSVGTCEVNHGEDVRGDVTSNPWTLRCPEHSCIELQSIPKGAASTEELIQLAREYPPEPVQPPEVIEWKPFNTATGSERLLLLSDKNYEQSLLTELTTKNIFGVRCDVCEQDVDPKMRLRCQICDVIFCRDCSLTNVDGSDGSGSFKCTRCTYTASKDKSCEEYEVPRCLACYRKCGWLRKGVAKPLSRKSLPASKKYGTSYFGRQLWVHTLCTFWNPKLNLSLDTGVVNCSNVVMANGLGLTQPTLQCSLCGNTGGLKVKCSHDGCAYVIDGKRREPFFHVTCARMAGFEVNAKDDGHKMNFYVKCYRHGGNEYNLRAKLEDMIEIEKRRGGKLLAKIDAPMGFAHASRLLHSGIWILRVLGWAWQWAEQWVDYNSSWEPLLEPGEKEENMTKEQLKIVDSTRETRCEAARACRLAAFGAALRNRSFDTEVDYDREAFDQALVSILKTKCLVGPLLQWEIDFYRHWLSLAYWSKSRHLGFGEDKIAVCPTSNFCLHSRDQSPKFELGSRPLPGTQSITPLDETDNYMISEVISDDMLDSLKQLPTSLSRRLVSPVLARPRRSIAPSACVIPLAEQMIDETEAASMGRKKPSTESARRPKASSIIKPDESKKRKRSKDSSRNRPDTQPVSPHQQLRNGGRSRNSTTPSVPSILSTPCEGAKEQTVGTHVLVKTNLELKRSGLRTRSSGSGRIQAIDDAVPSSVAPETKSVASTPGGQDALNPELHSPSSYDRAAVRRARRPPFVHDEDSVDDGLNATPGGTGDARAVETKRRKRGRPPKLTNIGYP